MNEQEKLLEHVKGDLDKALAIEIEDISDTSRVREGQTIWKDAGSMTKSYTLVESLGSVPMGSPMRWRVHYTSHGGTVMWLRTAFDSGTWKHVIEDDFFMYPS